MSLFSTDQKIESRQSDKVLYSPLLREVNGNCGHALPSDIKQTKEMSLLKYLRQSVVGLRASCPSCCIYLFPASMLFWSALHFSLLVQLQC